MNDVKVREIPTCRRQSHSSCLRRFQTKRVSPGDCCPCEWYMKITEGVTPPEYTQATAGVTRYQRFNESNVVLGQIDAVLGDKIIKHHLGRIFMLPILSRAKPMCQRNGVSGIAYVT